MTPKSSPPRPQVPEVYEMILEELRAHGDVSLDGEGARDAMIKVYNTALGNHLASNDLGPLWRDTRFRRYVMVHVHAVVYELSKQEYLPTGENILKHAPDVIIRVQEMLHGRSRDRKKYDCDACMRLKTHGAGDSAPGQGTQQQ